MSDAALDALADAAGIEARYWDIQGRLHERSPDTARHVLRGLGILAASDAEIAASLTLLTEEAWRETLPPVIVAKETGPICVAFRLAASTAARSLRWSIDLEGGERVGGESRLDLRVEAIKDIDGSTIALYRLELPRQPLGYHRLRVTVTGEAASDLIVVPARCHLPENRNTRVWGISTQLYAIRSDRNWGIGDFGDLGALVHWSAGCGAGLVGVNPLHALFLDAPESASPYSPSSRLFLNPLYLDVTAIPDFAESEAARGLANSSAMAQTLDAARGSKFVSYASVAAAKMAVLEELHSHFRTTHARADDERGRAFLRFVGGGGVDLNRFATFHALCEKFATHDWMRWPDGSTDPNSDEVARFTRDRGDRVTFYQYLQWQCELQLAAVATSTKMQKTPLGLYRDLAVSVDVSSSDHWANQEWFLRDMRVGAPPDPFNETGQEWGVIPPNPRRLRATGYAHFIALLRANMRHAGALRVDHVMGWQRLFVIPAGALPKDGAYLRFPLAELLSIAALESERNQCIVIGEDLGTVPEGFRERMADTNVLSCRVLYFEQSHGRFRQPAEFPALAAVSATTHDLATLRGYWTGDDIALKTSLGIFKSAEEADRARGERERDKQRLVEALAKEGLLSSGLQPADAAKAPWSAEIANAVHIYLARSSAALLTVQLDDLIGEQQQPNLPGTATEYPNWRRRLDRTLEDIAADSAIGNDLKGIARARQLP
jgi:(1->4)-alpha-D-glucan 1-alpha-D-glucosylmutase